MIAFFSTIILALLVCVDGYAIGFIFGLKRINIPFSVVLMLSAFSMSVLFFSMGIGRLIGEIIPSPIIQTTSGIFLIGIGIYQLFHDLPLYRRSYFLVVALFMNIDSVSYGIQAGLAERTFWFAPLAGFFILITFILGVIHGHQTKNRFIVRYLSLLPSFIFILLGLSKLFF
ncbi:hypothetical protein [Bacillus suaedae]|uniref:Uncharacterized protein n=1 Tax=Halalkalibacter suaedae TaxID=2822140 RepID=A0A940WWG4_9BACI|nr:hypothetical protein [Bacillus suaedae]MBP3952958.1 hypothetical protein [Bacillus suaedae]